MLKLLPLLSLALHLAQAAETTIYTGFNYGAFWGSVGNAKTSADFKAGFGYAQDLKTDVPFNSARLYTCKQQGTDEGYSPAFDAAVETKTKLLLGIWISPAKRGDPLDKLILTELSSLGNGFEKHGQALADLVIGLSVGSEDVFRWEDDKENVGVSATDVTAAIKKVKDSIAKSDFAKYMADKPIGHVDTAKHAVVDGADFYGITVYPYWNKDPVANAKESFKGTLDDVTARAKGKPIWIAEVGWPCQGESQGSSQANAQSLQQFWTDVGCTIIGKYTTFWFQLIKDSEAIQPDWGMIDSQTHKARIDLSCQRSSQPSTSAPPASSLPASTPATTVASTKPSSSSPSSAESSAPAATSMSFTAPSVAPSSLSSPASVGSSLLPSSPPTLSGASSQSGGHDDLTSTTIMTATEWVPPSSVPAAPGITSAPSVITIPGSIPWCVTMADIDSNGQLLPIAGGPAGSDGKCAPAPPTTAAPSSSVVLKDVPWCVTVADVGWNGQYMPVAGNAADSDGNCDAAPTYTGLPYTSAKSVPTPAPAPAPSTTPALPVSASTSNSLSVASSVCKPKTGMTAVPPAPGASGTAKPPISAIPVTSANTAPAPPGIPAPSDAPPASSIPLPSSSVKPVPSSSAPSAIPPGSAAPAPSKPATPPAASMQHPYCKRKSSSLSGPVAPPSKAPAPAPAPTSTSATLPDFQLATDAPAARREVNAGNVRGQDWFGWWW